jgi:hypothetical protein
MVSVCRAWFRGRRILFARFIFNFLYRNDPVMQDIINNSVNNRTVKNIMEWLDHRRILHCVFCPRNEELRKHPLGMMCKTHFEGHERAAKEAPSKPSDDLKLLVI